MCGIRSWESRLITLPKEGKRCNKASIISNTPGCSFGAPLHAPYITKAPTRQERANGCLPMVAQVERYKEMLVYHRNAFHALLRSSMWYIGPCFGKKVFQKEIAFRKARRRGGCSKSPTASPQSCRIRAGESRASATAAASPSTTIVSISSTTAAIASHLGESRINLLLGFRKDCYEITSLFCVWNYVSGTSGDNQAEKKYVLSVVKRVMAVPLRPARPVRPMR